MTVHRAHGHERKKQRPMHTANEPITLEQYRRLQALDPEPDADDDDA